MPTLSISDYGIIGNYASSALVNRIGGIDWCCLPFLDSPSHFDAILDPGSGGRFQLSPQGDFRSEQRYIPRTLVLETVFETPSGRAILTDWMPLYASLSSEALIYRRIEVLEGKMGWSLICDPRFDYGETPTEVEFRGTPAEKSARSEIWSRRHLLFRGSAPGQIAQLFSSLDLNYGTFYSGKEIVEAKFNLVAGQSALFAWTWGRRFDAPGAPQVSATDPSVSSLQETTETWRKIGHQCSPRSSSCLFAGPWHDASTKTALFLRLLLAPYSGSMAEALTTSLGPSTGTSDARYAWLRNCGFNLQALAALGMRNEAKNYFDWLSEIVIRDGIELLQPVYTLDGGKTPAERELRTVKGYQGLRPVRVGSDVSSQFHLDIYGHILLAADFYQREWGRLPDGLWTRIREIADFVCGAWRRPDHGPWDNRDKAEHYVVSKALCWAALDRASAIATRIGQESDSRWTNEMKILQRTILNQGFDAKSNTFVRSFGDTEIDASSLLLALIGFLPFDDPRISGTVDAVMERLSEGVLLRRSTLDPPNLLHLASSFLLIANLALGGRVDEASDRMAELCTFTTELGFMGEEMNAGEEESSGNFPNASAHLALINAAAYIGAARGRALPIQNLFGRPEAPSARAASRHIA